MALFTAAERDTIKAAYLTALSAGFASVSIAGQAVQTYSADALYKILSAIQADIAADNTSGMMGMRTRKTIPPEAG